LLRWVGIYEITPGQKSTMSSALTKIRQDVVSSCLTMRYDAFLADADWDHVILKSHLEHPYKSNSLNNRKRLSSKNGFLKTTETTDMDSATGEDIENERSDMDKYFEEARQRALNALKTSFTKQRNKGLLTDEGVTVLRQAVDSVQNDPTSIQLISINQLKRNWKLFGIIPRIRNMIETHLYGNTEKEVRNPWRKRIPRKCHKAALSMGLEILMQVIIMLNMMVMIVESVLERKRIIITAGILDELDETNGKVPEWDEYNEMCERTICGREIMENISFFFLAIYIVEAGFKGFSLTWKEYFKSKWNMFDFVIVVISIVEAIASSIIQNMILQQSDAQGGSNKGANAISVIKSIKIIKLVKSLKVIKALRIARLLRFSKTIIPMILTAINTRIHSRIRFGYDVGRGFIKGVEELDSALDMIAGDSQFTKKRLRRISEKSKSQIVRDLGVLQRSHPGIATSVKTKTAVRNLINVMLDSVKRLQDGGILDDFEVRVLHDQINILVKSLSMIPLSMPTPDPQNLFLNIHWVNGDKKLAEFLKENSEICYFDLNDLIIQDDEEPDAIYLIISGMVKIVHGQYRDTQTSDMSCDMDHDQDDEDQICDYASTGIVVGEMGCLVGENAQTSVICETAVVAFQIPVEVIREAYVHFPKLLDTLWSVVGMKIAVPLLVKDIKFQGFSADELRKHLQSSYVATFDQGSEIPLGGDISEVILLDGCVFYMQEYVQAPALIQETGNFAEDGLKSIVGHNQGVDRTIQVQERAVVLIVKRSKKEMQRGGRAGGGTSERASSHIIRSKESRSALAIPKNYGKRPVTPNTAIEEETTVDDDGPDLFS